MSIPVKPHDSINRRQQATENNRTWRFNILDIHAISVCKISYRMVAQYCACPVMAVTSTRMYRQFGNSLLIRQHAFLYPDGLPVYR